MIPTPTGGPFGRSAAVRALAVATVVSLSVAGAVVGVAAPATAAPETWTVTSTADAALPASCTPGSSIVAPAAPVTLRDALCAANNRGAQSTTITLEPGNYALAEALGSLTVGTQSGAHIALKGPSDRSAIISGDGKKTVMVLDPDMVGGVSVAVEGLTIRGGVSDVLGGGGILGGSALGHAADSLSITNSLITGNKSATTGTVTNAPGGGVQFIGGSLSIVDSTISSNSSGSSSGGGVAYQATGVTGESFTIRNSIFEGNSLSSANAAAIGGGAIEFTAGQALPGFTASIVESEFNLNTVSAAAGRPARAAAIMQNSGPLEVLRSQFNRNTVNGPATGAGVAIHNAGGVTEAHFNSFTGNTGSGGFAVVASGGSGSPVNAANNWWGCNLPADPAAPWIGCDTVSSGVTARPALQLALSANPQLIPIGATTAAIELSFLKNSAGLPVAASDLTLFEGAAIALSGVAPAAASVSPNSGVLSAGRLTATYNTGNAAGPASVSATLGSAKVTTAFGIAQAPAFTSSSTAQMRLGAAGQFAITSEGYPYPSITVDPASLPAGVQLVDNGDGTALLSGTPSLIGDSIVTVTSTVPNMPPVTQQLSLSIFQAVTFTSADAAAFSVGNSQSFTINTQGHPLSALSVTGDQLPSGLTIAGGSAGAASAVLSGTPAPGTGGEYHLTFTRGNGIDANVVQNFTLTVNEAPTITSANSFALAVGSAASVEFTSAPGFPAATKLSLSGALPAGVTAVTDAGSVTGLTGTPARASGGVYSLILSATNSSGLISQQSITLVVNEAPYVIGEPSDAQALVGSAANFTVSVGGYPAPSGEWQISHSRGAAWSSLGETGTTLSFVTAQSDNDALIRYFVNNLVTSRSAVLTVGTGPAIASDGAALWRVDGTAQSFEVLASGIPDAVITATPTAPLPAWLSIGASSAGRLAITGTPPAASGGVYTFTVSASNVFGTSASTTLSITVEEAPSITAPSSIDGSVGTAFGPVLVHASGGYPASAVLSYDTASILPDGITVVRASADSYLVSGTPSETGSYALSFTAKNSANGPTSTLLLPLNVATAPTIQAPSSFEIAAGVGGSFAVSVTPGYPTATTLNLVASNGFSLAASGTDSYLVSVDPSVPSGTYPLVLNASNASAHSSAVVTVTVRQPPRILSQPSSLTVMAGATASFSVTLSLAVPSTGAATSVWQRSTDGVTWNDVLSMPALGGLSSFGFTASQVMTGSYYRVVITDGSSVTSNTVQLTVVTPPAFTSAASAAFEVGTAGSFVVSASGSPLPALTANALPAGLSFVDNGNGTGTISGTPAAGTGGSHTVSLGADNGHAPTAVQSLVLAVAEKPTFTSADAATVTVGAAVAVSVASSAGFPGAVELNVAGALPAGVTVADNANGTASFSGSAQPGSGGEYVLRITATNDAGTTTQAFTLTVTERPQISSDDSATFRRGVENSVQITTAGGFPSNPSVSISGSLPSGLVFATGPNGTATISGTTTQAAGEHTLTITATNSAGLSTTQSFTLTVAELSAVVPPTQLPAAGAQLNGVPSAAAPGAALNVEASGFAAFSPVVFAIYSTPTTLATVQADAAGVARATITIPAGFTGKHSIVAMGTSPSGAPLFVRSDITVVAPGTPQTGGDKPIPGAALSVSGFDGFALAVSALLLLVLGGIVLVVAISRKRRARGLD